MQLSDEILQQAKEAGVKVYLGRSELKKSDLSDKSIEILLDVEDGIRKEWQMDIDMGSKPSIGASLYLYGYAGNVLTMLRGPSEIIFSRVTKSDITEALRAAIGEDKVAAYARYVESVVVGLMEPPEIPFSDLRSKLEGATSEEDLKTVLKEINGLSERIKADAVMVQYQAVNGEAVLAMTQIKNTEEGSRELGSVTLWLVMDPSSSKGGNIFNNITQAFTMKEVVADAKRQEEAHNEEESHSPHSGQTH